MQVDRFLKLVEWGFNVPLFVMNPNTNWKDDTYQFLIEHFKRPKTLTILASRKDGDVSLYQPSLPLRTVFVDIVVLEHRYEVIVMEDIACEFSGHVEIHDDGTGEYCLSGERPVRFSVTELIESVKMRCIVRILSNLPEKAGGAVSIQFAWAKRFCGVNKSRLIVFDYILTF